MLLFYWCFCNHSRVKVGILCGGMQTCRGDGGGHLGGRWSCSGVGGCWPSSSYSGSVHIV